MKSIQMVKRSPQSDLGVAWEGEFSHPPAFSATSVCVSVSVRLPLTAQCVCVNLCVRLPLTAHFGPRRGRREDSSPAPGGWGAGERRKHTPRMPVIAEGTAANTPEGNLTAFRHRPSCQSPSGWGGVGGWAGPGGPRGVSEWPGGMQPLSPHPSSAHRSCSERLPEAGARGAPRRRLDSSTESSPGL